MQFFWFFLTFLEFLSWFSGTFFYGKGIQFSSVFFSLPIPPNNHMWVVYINKNSKWVKIPKKSFHKYRLLSEKNSVIFHWFWGFLRKMKRLNGVSTGNWWLYHKYTLQNSKVWLRATGRLIRDGFTQPKKINPENYFLGVFDSPIRIYCIFDFDFLEFWFLLAG